MTHSLNNCALDIVEKMTRHAQNLNIKPYLLDNGCRVIDCGHNVTGGLEAGRLFALACVADMGTLRFHPVEIAGWGQPGLTFYTDQPALACMAAQYSGWMVTHGDYVAKGSGPARALVSAEADLYQEIGHTEQEHEGAVLCLASQSLPPTAVATDIATAAKISPGNLALLSAPTTSIVGAVQVAARCVETGIHKLHELGFGLKNLISGFGTCPIAPVSPHHDQAFGRVNDAILYGGRVSYVVDADDDTLAELVPKVPSSASAQYGEPFARILDRYNGDFHQIDPLLFSPAEITVTNIKSGRTFRAGQVNADILRQSFLG